MEPSHGSLLLLGFRQLLLRIHDEFLAALARFFKTHNTVRLCEKGSTLPMSMLVPG